MESTSSSNDFPRYGWVLVLTFEFPILFGKFCFVFIPLVIKRLLVVAEPFFECSFSETDVLHWNGIVISIVIDRYRGFINCVFGETFSIQRALVFHDTVAGRNILVVGRLEDTFVVAIDERFYIFRTTIAHFYCVAIEYLVELMSFGKMFVEECQETMSDFGGY